MQNLIKEILNDSKNLAVIGVKNSESEDAFKIPDYMFKNGYRIYSVNPKLSGTVLFNQKVFDNIASINDKIDTVVIFRKPEFLLTHANEILQMKHLPKYVWFQLGITNDSAAKLLEENGIKVIQNRCIMVEHIRLNSMR
jgi:predicted CoA-binding protein